MWLSVHSEYIIVIGDASHSRYQDGSSLWRLLYQTNTQVGRGTYEINNDVDIIEYKDCDNNCFRLQLCSSD